jgi:5'(3')-deoxyribonucleotidase
MLKTIAWDVDDVLNDLMQSWFEQKWLTDHPECAMLYEDIAENPPARLLNTSLDRYLRSLDEFRLSYMYQQMFPVKEVMNWFVKNGSSFRHIALTAVPLIAASASAQWVFNHFGAWIRTFHFVPSKREGEEAQEYDNDKGDFLKWIQKVDVLVDDSLTNIKAAESAGIKGIILPRPWNKGEEQRAKGVEERAKLIVKALKELENI